MCRGVHTGALTTFYAQLLMSTDDIKSSQFYFYYTHQNNNKHDQSKHKEIKTNNQTHNGGKGRKARKA